MDKVEPRDVLRKRVIELVGEDEDKHTFKQIAHKDYLKALDKDRFGEKAKGDLVAVVVAKGTILDGTQPPGQIGGDSTAALIRQARHDDDVKAIVLRVDSPGGSGFASEVIRRELELARAGGKVVVVSMGSVAASGGYWISMAADEVLASPNTITGSIGIFGMFPTFQKPLAKYLGMHVDGVGTTSLAGALRPDRALDPRVAEVIQAHDRPGVPGVPAGRLEGPKDDPRGRGQGGPRSRLERGKALDLGLVDKLGGLDDAVAAAAAKLGTTTRCASSRRSSHLKEKLVRASRSVPPASPRRSGTPSRRPGSRSPAQEPPSSGPSLARTASPSGTTRTGSTPTASARSGSSQRARWTPDAEAVGVTDWGRWIPSTQTIR